MSKKTLILGASTDPSRYSNIATHRLLAEGHEVLLVGNKKGEVAEKVIHNDTPIFSDIDTVTLYVNPTIQESYYDYIFALNPKRVIFNPGTENPVFFKMIKEKNIEAIMACTLVMLATGEY